MKEEPFDEDPNFCLLFSPKENLGPESAKTQDLRIPNRMISYFFSLKYQAKINIGRKARNEPKKEKNPTQATKWDEQNWFKIITHLRIPNIAISKEMKLRENVGGKKKKKQNYRDCLINDFT